MQTEQSIDIDRPIEEVFDYTVHNVAEWSTVVVEDEVMQETDEGVGSTLRIVTEERGHQMEFVGLVTRHDPPTAHTIVMTGEQFDIEAEYRFEDLNGRTRVTQRSIVTGKGMVRVMLFLFGWLMGKSSSNALDRELANLKRLMECKGDPPAT